MKGFIILGLGMSSVLSAQIDTAQEVKFKRLTLRKGFQFPKKLLTCKRFRAKNLGQDLPILLKNQMSVVATSRWKRVAYTGFRIRGSAGTSINVMLNGVPCIMIRKVKELFCEYSGQVLRRRLSSRSRNF